MTSFDDWVTPAWQACTVDWLDAALADAGIALIGPVDHLRARAWGAESRAPTTAGPVWLKVTSPLLAFELPLCAALSG